MFQQKVKNSIKFVQLNEIDWRLRLTYRLFYTYP